MSEEQLTEREAALLARVAELEARTAQLQPQPAQHHGGNIVDQLWHYILAFVPVPIVMLGIAVFGGYHAWEYYNEAQQLAVETHLKTAKAAVEKAKADAANVKVAGDESARVATMRAEVQKKQAEAARSKIELDAQSTDVNGETVKLQTMRAEVEGKAAQAAKARALADAAMKQEGAQTLEEQTAKAKLRLTEFDAISNNVDALMPSVLSGGRQRIIDALCANRFAKEIGCTASYTERYLSPDDADPPTCKDPTFHYVARYDVCCSASHHYNSKTKMCDSD